MPYYNTNWYYTLLYINPLKEDSEMKYKIIRHYFNNYGKRTIMTGLTLEQAQAHCRDPETSSSTCTTWEGKQRTKKYGAWFDGYSED